MLGKLTVRGGAVADAETGMAIAMVVPVSLPVRAADVLIITETAEAAGTGWIEAWKVV